MSAQERHLAQKIKVAATCVAKLSGALLQARYRLAQSIEEYQITMATSIQEAEQAATTFCIKHKKNTKRNETVKKPKKH